VFDASVSRPGDAVASGPIDAAAPLLSGCTRSLIEGRTIGGVDLTCNEYLLSDMWTLNGPRCEHRCIADDIARAVRHSGGVATVERVELAGLPDTTLVTIEENGTRGWFVLVSPRADRTVTCRRVGIAPPDHDARTTIATCKTMLDEWLAVERPDHELCARVAAHAAGLTRPGGAGTARLREQLVNGCLGSTRAWADCSLAIETLDAWEACNRFSEPSE
jgi:hypothetical protein